MAEDFRAIAYWVSKGPWVNASVSNFLKIGGQKTE